MKYPCADGIDRDLYIERFLRLRKELGEISADLELATMRRDRTVRELGDLMFDYLGGAGMAAVYEALNKPQD